MSVIRTLLPTGCRIGHEVQSTVTNERRLEDLKIHRSVMRLVNQDALPSTADVSCGTDNLVTQPRAGNISSDTRAGTSA
jgi:hypothetical protein